MELYSTFYISIVSQDFPRPAIGNDQPSLSHILSPLSSPGGSEELAEENRMHKLQLNKYKDLLQDKSEQLIEKGETLISCQSTNVKHERKDGPTCIA